MMRKLILAATLVAVTGTSLAVPAQARFGGFHAFGGLRGFGGGRDFRGFDGVRGIHYGAYGGGAYGGGGYYRGYGGGGYYRGYGALAAGTAGAAAGASIGATGASSYYRASPSNVCVAPGGNYYAC
jgi:hypothetical protein